LDVLHRIDIESHKSVFRSLTALTNGGPVRQDAVQILGGAAIRAAVDLETVLAPAILAKVPPIDDRLIAPLTLGTLVRDQTNIEEPVACHTALRNDFGN